MPSPLLPPGFEIESNPETAATPALPAGFEVESVPTAKRKFKGEGDIPKLPLAKSPIPEGLQPDAPTTPTMGMYGVPLPAPPPSQQIDAAKIARGTLQNVGQLFQATAPLTQANPEFGGQYGGAPPNAQQVQNFGDATERPLVPLADGAQPGTLTHGILSGAQGLTSPANLAILAGTTATGGVLGGIAKGLTGYNLVAVKGLNLALSGYFTAQAAKGFTANTAAAYQAWQKGDMDAVAENLGAGSVNGLFTAFGLAHGLSSVKDLLATKVPRPALNPEVVSPETPAEPEPLTAAPPPTVDVTPQPDPAPAAPAPKAKGKRSTAKPAPAPAQNPIPEDLPVSPEVPPAPSPEVAPVDPLADATAPLEKWLADRKNVVAPTTPPPTPELSTPPTPAIQPEAAAAPAPPAAPDVPPGFEVETAAPDATVAYRNGHNKIAIDLKQDANGDWSYDSHYNLQGFAGGSGSSFEKRYATPEEARAAGAQDIIRRVAPIAAGQAGSAATDKHIAEAKKMMSWLGDQLPAEPKTSESSSSDGVSRGGTPQVMEPPAGTKYVLPSFVTDQYRKDQSTKPAELPESTGEVRPVVASQIDDLAAQLRPHADGANEDLEHRKQYMTRALDLRRGAVEGTLSQPEMDYWESKIRPIINDLNTRLAAKRDANQRRITADTPASEMSAAEFKEHRREQALAFEFKDPELADPDKWTPEKLDSLSKAQLAGLCNVHGQTTTGTKPELVKRLFQGRDLRKQFAGRTPEEIAKSMSGAQIEEVLRQLGASLFGNKTVRAGTILTTLAKQKAKGEMLIAEENHKRAIAAEQKTKPAELPESTLPPIEDDRENDKEKNRQAILKHYSTPVGAVVRRGEIDPNGAYFSKAGSWSTYSEPEDASGPKDQYDLSSATILDGQNPEAVRILARAALKDKSLTPQEAKRLQELIADDAPTLSYLDADELPMADAGKRLGFDGMTVFENDDIADPSSVFLWNTEHAAARAASTEVPEGFEVEAQPATIEADEREPSSTDPGESGPAPVRGDGSQDPQTLVAESAGDGEATVREGDALPDRGSTRAASGRNPQRLSGSESPAEPSAGNDGEHVDGDSAVSSERNTGERQSGPGNLSSVSTAASRDYRITGDTRLGEGSPRDKLNGNLDAIRIVKQLAADGRDATPAEQHQLARYIGWGGMSQIFDTYRREWAGAREELKSLLTPDEYKAAEASTKNAHYTSQTVVSGMWDALTRIGVKPGFSVIEPSMGVGNFFGLQPESLLPARRTGIELDHITGAIAKALYPDSNIQVTGFEKVKLPENFFDVAISNVPFGNYPVYDPAYKRNKAATESIHNYFFVKGLDLVRPGGVVAFVTSRYTLDAQSETLRKQLAAKADLLGAIRLPNTAFKGNAGTQVVTDIIFLRKRAEGEEPGPMEWTKTATVNVPANESGISTTVVNEYFAKHPEMMLGTLELGRGMYSNAEQTLSGEVTPENLAAAVDKLPRGIYQEWKAETPVFEGSGFVQLGDEVKDGGYAVKDGVIVRRDGDIYRPATNLNSKQIERIKSMIPVRSAVRKVFETQIGEAPQKDILAARAALNKAYDAFVKKHGPISASANQRSLADEPDLPVLTALEDYDKESNTAKKTAIFTERTIERPKTPDSVEKASEALAISLNERGRLDWDRMQQLTGKTPEEMREEMAGLVYKNPEGQKWETADEYLAGRVRDKLAIARAAAKADPAYQPNVDALEKVQPRDLTPEEIRVTLGASWIPPQVVGQFMNELLDLGGLAKVHYSNTVAAWSVDLPKYAWDRTANAKTYGTDDYYAHQLVEAALNGKAVRVYRDGPDDTRVLDKEATTAAQAALDALREKFKEWMWTDDKRATQLADKYNAELNNLRLVEHDGSHLTLPGSNKAITLRPHQKNVIWRALKTGNTLLAHEVGAGKTWEMVGIAMESRRLGLVQEADDRGPEPHGGTIQRGVRAAVPGCARADHRERGLSRPRTASGPSLALPPAIGIRSSSVTADSRRSRYRMRPIRSSSTIRLTNSARRWNNRKPTWARVRTITRRSRKSRRLSPDCRRSWISVWRARTRMMVRRLSNWAWICCWSMKRTLSRRSRSSRGARA